MISLKNFNLRILKKSLIGLILFVIILYVGIFIYSYMFEKDKIAIDNYNFQQLDKVKNILNNKEGVIKHFNTLEEFNNQYDTNIMPIKNCYYISNYNGNEAYIFGFKLESDKYKEKYGQDYYVYPKYNIEEMYICTGRCYDGNFHAFLYAISNPCED